MSNVETNEKVTEKVLVFNPGGFVLKLIFAIGFLVFMGPEFKPEGFMDAVNTILLYVLLFFGLYAMATLFGFAVRVTGNYIIGLVVFGVLLAVFISLFSKVEALLAGLGSVGELLINIVFIAILVWPVISDVKKAILYVKNTV